MLDIQSAVSRQSIHGEELLNLAAQLENELRVGRVGVEIRGLSWVRLQVVKFIRIYLFLVGIAKDQFIAILANHPGVSVLGDDLLSPIIRSVATQVRKIGTSRRIYGLGGRGIWSRAGRLQ